MALLEYDTEFILAPAYIWHSADLSPHIVVSNGGVGTYFTKLPVSVINLIKAQHSRPWIRLELGLYFIISNERFFFGKWTLFTEMIDGSEVYYHLQTLDFHCLFCFKLHWCERKIDIILGSFSHYDYHFKVNKKLHIANINTLRVRHSLNWLFISKCSCFVNFQRFRS